jgi:Trk K+ transport system NAD-binding subunit
MVAAMSLGSKALSSSLIAGIPHVTAEVRVESGSELAGKRVEEAERGYCCKILARTPNSGPIQLPAESKTMISPGDLLVVHTPSSQMATLAAAGRGAAVGMT